MSYWVSFNENICKICGRVDELDSRNMTSNVSSMWTKALGIPLIGLHNKKASEYIELLEDAVEDMYNNYEEYLPLNPKNGWGSVESARDYLEWMLAMARDYPDSMIEISH